MASPEVLEFGELLEPIPGENPTGVDLRADSSPGSLYYAIKDARSQARAAERQVVMDDEEGGAPADWRPVTRNGTKALKEKTKDLEIVAYMIEALVREHGFPGLRDGFRLARALVEKFWDGLFPVPDEEGLATRVAALSGLNGDDAEGTLIAPIAKVPITDVTSIGRLTSADYQKALAISKIADPELREKKIAKGGLSVEAFERAVREGSPKFYAGLVEDLTQCVAEFAKMTAALDERCGGHAPPSSSIRSALETCLDTVKSVARDKLALIETGGETASGSATSAASAEGDRVSTNGGGLGVSADALRTREDALRQLLKVADYFRRSEPHTPLSYALEQVVRWGKMTLPELLTELIPDDAPRNSLFKQIGIKTAASASAAAAE
jgi:type VI secretion system protein ImpA